MHMLEVETAAIVDIGPRLHVERRRTHAHIHECLRAITPYVSEQLNEDWLLQNRVVDTVPSASIGSPRGHRSRCPQRLNRLYP
ncbi:hypothetical protein GCM10011408_36240 [Dyella caseinilytica]|nr:hypothetical protein GCM10011408_36240 [Dyella caseinilytica]